MRRVFLDIGAHVGETLRVVADPRWQFDRIVCFEPVLECCDKLRAFRDDRVQVCPYGLWNATEQLEIFDPGAAGAGIHSDKIRRGRKQMFAARSEAAQFVRASDWFRDNLTVQDQVFVKVNTEGSECDIIDDLLDSGEFRKIHRLLVSFDVRKVPSQRHREIPVRERLKSTGVAYWVYEDLPRSGKYFSTLQSWLHAAGAGHGTVLPLRARLRSLLWTMRYVSVPRLVKRTRVARAARKIIPTPVFVRVKRFFKEGVY